MYMQAGSTTNNLDFKIYFTLPELSATKIMTWNYHVDYSAKVNYDMISGRYILTALGLNINYLITSLKQIMEPLKGWRHPWLIWVRMSFKI